MLCPACKTDLVMSERQNIEIDYCPKCRGVWLDRGELDKIIERSAKEAPAAAAPPPQAQPQGQPWVQQPQYQPPPQPQYQQHHHHGHYKKRKSFLEELFD
jgi:Zn-finger nucleic acid-binding protein